MLTKLNPYIRFAGNICKDRNDEKAIVAHDFRLFCVKSGSGIINVHGTDYDLVSGAVVYLPPYIRYKFMLNGRSKTNELSLQVLNFDLTHDVADRRDDFVPIEYDSWNGVRVETGDIPIQLSLPIITSGFGVFDGEFDKIIDLFFLSEPYYREFSSAYAKVLLLKLISAKKKDRQASAAEPILDYIRENFRSEYLTNELTERFSYHPNHINRLVKMSTGLSLKGYVIAHRIKVGKDLLASTDKSVADVAWECGFSSPSYFSEQFIKNEGITPREFRKKVRSSLI